MEGSVCTQFVKSMLRILNELIHFHYMAYMVTPWHKNPCPGAHEIYKGRPFSIHPFYNLSLYNLCPGAVKKTLKERMKFRNMTKAML